MLPIQCRLLYTSRRYALAAAISVMPARASSLSKSGMGKSGTPITTTANLGSKSKTLITKLSLARLHLSPLWRSNRAVIPLSVIHYPFGRGVVMWLLIWRGFRISLSSSVIVLSTRVQRVYPALSIPVYRRRAIRGLPWNFCHTRFERYAGYAHHEGVDVWWP